VEDDDAEEAEEALATDDVPGPADVPAGAATGAAGAVPPLGADGGGASGVEVQATSHPRIAAPAAARSLRGHTNGEIDMWIILLEALAAGVLLVLIVWWVMFAGRSRGERRPHDDE
jgi:hypothetical protein